ncbi:MAG TPA: pyridoxal 5'-phosphate synthase glutaminase subunit PdxT [bacterium]|nr:pyridoxal 5'-phosphate synthase glutaminase subunit PdxT [bacterium]
MSRIGVLALQGDFELHLKMLDRIGAGPTEVRTSKQLEEVNGLIIPGGESTTVSKLLVRYGLDREITKRFNEGTLAVYGTCMGLILVSKEVVDYPELVQMGFIDLKVMRNAYGPQVESFEEEVMLDCGNGSGPFSYRAVFIRAPQVCETGEKVRILARHNGMPVLMSQGNCLAGSFHPELTQDDRVHRYFKENFVDSLSK